MSLSSDVLPRIREWPRMSTTLLNAYLEPVLVHYIGDLSDGLDEGSVKTQQRFLMQSNGGVMPFKAAVAGGKTVHTLFSGPAAGAQAAAYLAAEDARKGLVTLDMGGTSCDIAFIAAGFATAAAINSTLFSTAKLAARVNETVENIGARRLQTMMERLLEDISFEAEDRTGETITIDAAYVRERLETLAGDTDLSKYIL